MRALTPHLSLLPVSLSSTGDYAGVTGGQGLRQHRVQTGGRYEPIILYPLYTFIHRHYHIYTYVHPLYMYVHQYTPNTPLNTLKTPSKRLKYTLGQHRVQTWGR